MKNPPLLGKSEATIHFSYPGRGTHPLKHERLYNDLTHIFCIVNRDALLRVSAEQAAANRVVG